MLILVTFATSVHTFKGSLFELVVNKYFVHFSHYLITTKTSTQSLQLLPLARSGSPSQTANHRTGIRRLTFRTVRYFKLYLVLGFCRMQRHDMRMPTCPRRGVTGNHNDDRSIRLTRGKLKINLVKLMAHGVCNALRPHHSRQWMAAAPQHTTTRSMPMRIEALAFNQSIKIARSLTFRTNVLGLCDRVGVPTAGAAAAILRKLYFLLNEISDAHRHRPMCIYGYFYRHRLDNAV